MAALRCTGSVQASELWITDGRSLTLAAEVLEDFVPMVAQIHRQNVEIVKSKCSRYLQTQPSGRGLGK